MVGTSSEDYIADLKTVQRSLAEANAKRSAYGPLQDLIWQAETFRCSPRRSGT